MPYFEIYSISAAYKNTRRQFASYAAIVSSGSMLMGRKTDALCPNPALFRA
jgi:hypothetical protein